MNQETSTDKKNHSNTKNLAANNRNARIFSAVSGYMAGKKKTSVQSNQPDINDYKCNCGKDGFVDAGEDAKNRFPCRECYREIVQRSKGLKVENGV